MNHDQIGIFNNFQIIELTETEKSSVVF